MQFLQIPKCSYFWGNRTLQTVRSKIQPLDTTVCGYGNPVPVSNWTVAHPVCVAIPIVSVRRFKERAQCVLIAALAVRQVQVCNVVVRVVGGIGIPDVPEAIRNAPHKLVPVKKQTLQVVESTQLNGNRSGQPVVAEVQVL